jgi:hypothetical protein
MIGQGPRCHSGCLRAKEKGLLAGDSSGAMLQGVAAVKYVGDEKCVAEGFHGARPGDGPFVFAGCQLLRGKSFVCVG